MGQRPDIEAIRARAEAATPGPWEWNDRDDYDGLPQLSIETRRGPDVCEQTATACAHGDAEFIAHAREDIPALLAYIADLEAIMARAYAGVIKHGERGKCGCWACEGIYDVMSEQQAERMLYPDNPYAGT